MGLDRTGDHADKQEVTTSGIRKAVPSLVLVSWLAALPVPALAAFPRPVGHVNDFASVIPPDAAAYLEGYLRTLERDTSAEVVVATVPSLDGSFKKWFGVNPAAKVKQDPKTAAVLLRYNEWTGEKNEKVRSFDMTEVHGVVVIAVVDGVQETSIGERLPNIKGDDKFTDTVGDVLGTSDVAYDEKGNIIEGKN